MQRYAGIGAVMRDKSLAVKYLARVTLLPSAIGIDAKALPAEQAEVKKFMEIGALWVASKRCILVGGPGTRCTIGCM